jgi:hypothetical protein
MALVFSIALISIILAARPMPANGVTNEFQNPVAISTLSNDIPTYISCYSSSLCMVGISSGHVFQYNGTSWSDMGPVDANNQISGISCVSNNFCLAVDLSGSALVYSGSTWSSPNTVNAFASLNGVSCASISFCMAVGSNGNVFSFNGTSWTGLGTIDPNTSLTAVSCAATTFCVIGDASGNTFTYDGSNFTGPVSIINELITSISCPVNGFCIAVDANSDAIIFQSGTWSSPTQIDSSVGISSISCYSSTFCEAVDASGNAINYNSGTWSSPELIDPFNTIVGVSCFASGNCFAVDNQSSIFSFSTNVWGVSHVLYPSSYLTNISCATTNFCVAVDVNGYEITYNGSTWGTPIDIDSNHYLTSVSCATTNFCVAVDDLGLAFTDSNGSWAQNSIDSSSGITDIDCISSAFCMAIDQAGNAISFNGTVWSSPQSIDSGIQLNSVSCVNTSFCVAVDGNGNELSYNGTSWTSAAQIDQYSIASINCQSNTYCVAVDSSGYAITFTTGAWSSPALEDTHGFISISCNTIYFCIAIDSFGNYDLYASIPIIQSISPDSGPQTGGTTVTITGINLDQVTSVAFGTTPAQSFSSQSSTTLVAVSPIGTGVVDIYITNQYGTSIPNSVSGFLYTQSGTFHAITPKRLVDTRPGASDPSTYQGQTLGPGASLNVNVIGANNDRIPDSAISVIANLTAVTPTATGYLTAYPTGLSIPSTSNLNFQLGQSAVANEVIIPVGLNGSISFYNAFGYTNILVDVLGYFSPAVSSAGLFNPIAPMRIADTRIYPGNNYQDAGVTIGPQSFLYVKITGYNGLPAGGMSAVSVNLTVTDVTAAQDWLTIYPAGTLRPITSNLNCSQGHSCSNSSVTALGGSGYITIYNALGFANIIVDVTGWYSNVFGTTGYAYHSLVPERLVDTRTYSGNPYQGAGHTFSSGTNQTYIIGGYTSDSIPVSATAVVANVTVTNTSANGGYFVIYPDNASMPATSNINWQEGQTVSDVNMLALGSDGGITAVAENSSADLIIDVSGWYG